VRAFLAVGILSGLAYWLVAGRRAGGERGDAPAPPVTVPAADAGDKLAKSAG
jgi:hypothetical protein